MIDNTTCMSDWRIRGIEEQYQRAIWFINLSPQALDPKARFRLEIGAVYPARAVVELMLESAESQELHAYRDNESGKSRRTFENDLKSRVAHYALIEKIRIHDFHRCGILPPEMERQEMHFQGPIKLISDKGPAIVSIGQNGLQASLSGNSSVKDRRSLCIDGGMIYDESGGGFLHLRDILVAYLTSMREAISWFRNQKAGESNP